MARAELEQARKDQERRYRQFLSSAAACQERAMKSGYEPDRRRLMQRADELRARAYHEVA